MQVNVAPAELDQLAHAQAAVRERGHNGTGMPSRPRRRLGLTMTGTPDEVPPLVPVELPGLTRTTYRAYPIPDHIADKVCGLLELQRRPDDPPAPSTRYRDLVDLATFAHTTEVDAAALAAALASETRRRGFELPDRLQSPTGPGWPAGYARVARDAPGLAERDLRAAMSTVGRFIDPVLSGDASGRWNSRTLRWKPYLRRR